MGRRPWIGLNLDVGGLDEMIADLREFERFGERRAHAALDRALGKAEEASRSLAHVHDGDLKASIGSESSAVPGGWRGSITVDKAGARAAHWEIERGGTHAEFVDGVEAAVGDQFDAAIGAAFEPLKKKRR